MLVSKEQSLSSREKWVWGRLYCVLGASGGPQEVAAEVGCYFMQQLALLRETRFSVGLYLLRFWRTEVWSSRMLQPRKKLSCNWAGSIQYLQNVAQLWNTKSLCIKHHSYWQEILPLISRALHFPHLQFNFFQDSWSFYQYQNNSSSSLNYV